MTHVIDRRSLLRSGFGTIGLGLFAPSVSARALFATRRDERMPGERNLVLLQLAGGNDGLSTVVPYADDGYHEARRTIRIAPDEVLRLDDYRGLHPGLARLQALYGEGRLGLVEGDGYPQPNRSHFKSFEVWHTADVRGRAAGEGWVGRLCQAAFGDDVSANRVVHVGGAVPYSLHSARHPAVSFTIPRAYRWIDSGDALAEVDIGQTVRYGDRLKVYLLD